ncbi:hypothetical protein JR338_03890 [Chloroflexota bacterium]|nr:hypothetical protein JR338_03890 [Chloroflexota bacterium]
MKKTLTMIFILLFLVVLCCSCANRVDYIVPSLSQTAQETIEVVMSTLFFTATVEPTPTLTNQETYENIMQEYQTLTDEFKAIIFVEGRSVFDSLAIVIDQYYNDFGVYPESIDDLIPEYLDESPKIFGRLEIYYHLLTDKAGYVLVFYSHPLGDRSGCASSVCWVNSGDEFTCEYQGFQECVTPESYLD